MSANDQPLEASRGRLGLVEIGAYLVLAVFIVFELIAGEYFVTNVALVLAAAVVALPRLAPRVVDAIAPGPGFVKASGFLLAFTGAIEFLDDIRFDAYDGFVSVLGAVIAYVGYVAAFVGARSLQD